MKYLIKTHKNVGELAFSCTLLNAIVRLDPGCHIEVLAPSPCHQLLQETPYINRIHVRPKPFHADLLLQLRLLRKDWDVVIILRSGGLLHLFYRFIKAKHKRHRAHIDDKQGKHEIEHLMSMLEGIFEGWNDIVDPTIHFDPKRSEKIIDKLGLSSEVKCLSIAPGASHERKMWDKDKFVEMIKTIGKSFDCTLVLGNSNEFELCEYVANNIDGINLAGKLELLDVCALLSFASLHIGNDSGLGHLAASTRTKCLAIGDDAGLQKSPWLQHMILGDVKNISVEEVSTYLRDNNLIQSD